MRCALWFITIALTQSCEIPHDTTPSYLQISDSTCMSGRVVMGGPEPELKIKSADPNIRKLHSFTVRFGDQNVFLVPTVSGQAQIKRVSVYFDYQDREPARSKTAWSQLAYLFDDAVPDGPIILENCFAIPYVGIPGGPFNTCTKKITKSDRIIFSSSDIGSEWPYVLIIEEIIPQVYIHARYWIEIEPLESDRAHELMAAIKRAANFTENCDAH